MDDECLFTFRRWLTWKEGFKIESTKLEIVDDWPFHADRLKLAAEAVMAVDEHELAMGVSNNAEERMPEHGSQEPNEMTSADDSNEDIRTQDANEPNSDHAKGDRASHHERVGENSEDQWEMTQEHSQDKTTKVLSQQSYSNAEANDASLSKDMVAMELVDDTGKAEEEEVGSSNPISLPTEGGCVVL